MSIDDRQADPRAAVEVEVHYRTVQEFTAAYGQNISGGGIFIQTRQALPLSSEILLRFTLPGIPRTILVRGLVVWSTPVAVPGSLGFGIGIKFLDLDPEARDLIGRFVKGKTLGPATEERN